MNSIFTRRSVRRFLDQEVEPDKIEQLLRAGMQAPSAYNQQAWHFVVVRGKQRLTELSQYNQYASCLKWANVGIIILANDQLAQLPQYYQQDLSACTQNILLQATELGLGAVWFGTAPDPVKMQYISSMFGLAEHLHPISVVAVGYPQDSQANHFVDRFDASKVTYIE